MPPDLPVGTINGYLPLVPILRLEGLTVGKFEQVSK